MPSTFPHSLIRTQLEKESISRVPCVTVTNFLETMTLAEKIELNDIRPTLNDEEFWEYNLTLILLLLESGAY